MRRRTKLGFLLAILLVGSMVVILGFSKRVVDYGSGASGHVVDESGKPVGGAEVTVHFNEVVFDATTPLRKARATTDDQGRFAEHFISCGKPGGAYRVVVKKVGFLPSVVPGSGIGEHRIVLRSATTAASREPAN